MTFLGIDEAGWELLGWVAGGGVAFFLLNVVGDRTWRRPREPRASAHPAE
ncbi:MAG: hypothetical protein HXY28_12055 [Hydrogenophilaceae bacterium]|nr:hypothetical protein [Hydrogenophilaceae bacterium]